MYCCNRRAFLKQIAAATASGTFLAGIAGCPRRQAPPCAPSEEPADVVAVRGPNLRRMTRDILDAFGGAQAIVEPGETVFIKPNLVSADLFGGNVMLKGECTKPEIVFAVAEACLEAGAEYVIIGDGAQVPRFDWTNLPTLDGTSTYHQEAERLNGIYDGRLTLACLLEDSSEWDLVPSPHTGMGELRVSSLVTRADKVISIPVAKTHLVTEVTLALKNFVGVLPLSPYAMGTSARMVLHATAGGIEQCFLDVAHAIKPDFAIIDFTIGLEGNGPVSTPLVGSEPIDMREQLGDWLLVGGNDLVAVDAVGTRITGQDPFHVPHIAMAFHQGLGQMRPSMINLVGQRLEDVQMDWVPAARYGLLSKGTPCPDNETNPPELWVKELIEQSQPM